MGEISNMRMRLDCSQRCFLEIRSWLNDIIQMQYVCHQLNAKPVFLSSKFNQAISIED